MTSIKLTDEEKDKLYNFLKDLEDEDTDPEIALTPDLRALEWELAIDFNELKYCQEDKAPIMVRIGGVTWDWLSEYQTRKALGITIEYSLERH